MPSTNRQRRSGAPEETAADTRVMGSSRAIRSPDPALQRLVELGEAKPGLKKVAVAHEDAPEGGSGACSIAGLGAREEFDAESARVAAPRRPRPARRSWARSRSRGRRLGGDGVAAALVEGTLLKLYSFDRFKSKRGDDAEWQRSSRSRSRGPPVDSGELERARIGASAANAARDLQNLPANVATPAFLAERAGDRRRARVAGARAARPRGDRGARDGRVRVGGAGSYEEPRLIVLRWRPQTLVGRTSASSARR